MTNHAQVVREINNSATICWTCGGKPNPNNFGGLCDPCTAERQQRLQSEAQRLADYDLGDTHEAKTLAFLGYTPR